MRIDYLVLLTGLCVALAACGQPDAIDVQWHDEHDYTLTLYDDHHQPLLRADISYLGRTPPDTDIEPGWQPGKTDFYRTTLYNLSSGLIELQEIRYRMDKGPLLTKATKDRAAIIADYGDYRLYPDHTLIDRDSYVWARDENALHRQFIFTLDDRPFEIDLPLHYRP